MTKSILIKTAIPVTVLAAGIFLCAGGVAARAAILDGTDAELTVYAMDKKYEFRYPEIDRSEGLLYLKNCEEVVDGIFYDTVIRPKDAEAKIDPKKSYPFSFTSEKNGKCVDKEKLVLEISDALNRGISEVRAPVVVLKPSVSVADLKAETVYRASFTTEFKNSVEERKDNIALACKYIGGRRLANGETFSFNDAVGERTEKRGFSSAKIIENGKFTEGVGGGVCQVSSTLYNAALLAGLEISERHSHSLAVGYVEPSFDAMVSTGYADLKISNRTGGGIYIVMTASREKVTAKIYGRKMDERYERVSKVKEEISPPAEQFIDSADLTIGETKAIVYPKKGLISVGYLERYDGGKLTERKLLSSDKYAPMQGIVLKGIKPPEDDGGN